MAGGGWGDLWRVHVDGVGGRRWRGSGRVPADGHGGLRKNGIMRKTDEGNNNNKKQDDVNVLGVTEMIHYYYNPGKK